MCHPPLLTKPLLIPAATVSDEQNADNACVEKAWTSRSYMASLLDFIIGTDHTLYEISSAFLPGVTELLHVSTAIFNALAAILQRNTFIVFFWFKSPYDMPICTFPLTFFERGGSLPDNIAAPHINLCLTGIADRTAHNIHACIQHFVILYNTLNLLQCFTQSHFNCVPVQYLQRRSILMIRTQNMMPEDSVLALTCDAGYLYRTTDACKDIPMMYDNNCIVFLICQKCGHLASLSETNNAAGNCSKCLYATLDVLYTTRTRGI